MGGLPSSPRPCSRWPHGLTNETTTEAIYAHRRTRSRPPPPPTPAPLTAICAHRRPPPRPPPPPTPPPLTAIWAQLPTHRRRRLQHLLADLLARPVTVAAAPPREGAHDHPAV